MEISSALNECSGLLTVAATALKRMLRSEEQCEETAVIGKHLDEVIDLAARLQALSETIDKPAGA